MAEFEPRPIQESFAAFACEIEALRARLQSWLQAIPVPTDDVLEGRSPWNLAYALRTTAEHVGFDLLAEAARQLDAAARATERQQKEAWLAWKQLRFGDDDGPGDKNSPNA